MRTWSILRSLLTLPLLLGLLAGCGTTPTASQVTPTAADAEPVASATAFGGESTAGISPGVEAGGMSPGGVMGAGSCVEQYSPATLANRTIAFDGTIKSVELRDDPDAGMEQPDGNLSTPWVVFTVNRWYKGGTAGEIGVWMPFAVVAGTDGSVLSEDMLTVEPGVRLLVAGEPRGIGEDPKEPIAWSCGFTQLYDAARAEEWEAATK